MAGPAQGTDTAASCLAVCQVVHHTLKQLLPRNASVAVAVLLPFLSHSLVPAPCIPGPPPRFLSLIHFHSP